MQRFQEDQQGNEMTLDRRNALMADVGDKVAQYNEILAGVKGQLSARAKVKEQ